MGFFSQLCEGCKHPALSSFAINRVNWWMNDVVAITTAGEIYRGEYDGYGRLCRFDEPIVPTTPVPMFDVLIGSTFSDTRRGSTVWHTACWINAGRPTEWTGESENAPDQGYFFDTEHDMPLPISEKTLITEPYPQDSKEN